MTLPGRHADRMCAVLELAQHHGADAFLTAHPATVMWLTGIAAPHPDGPQPFALPTAALVTPDEDVTILVPEDRGPHPAGDRVTVASYARDPTAMQSAIDAAVSRPLRHRTIATETSALPAALAGGLRWVDVSRDTGRLRARKDDDEIQALRAALDLCRIGQQAARAHAETATTEIELFGHIAATVEQAAGGRLPLYSDLVSGERTAQVGGPPGTRALAPGDPILCDLAPRHNGYWGDSCTTFAVGEPSRALRRAHTRVREALDRAIEAVKPGVTAGDLDTIARRNLAYAHHTGHGIGTFFHEEPRIVPDSETVLETGMVIALEPGHYQDDVGVRIERVVLVTPDGCEVLSTHDVAL